MEGGDGGLNLIGAGPAVAHRLVDQRQALGDHVAVPERGGPGRPAARRRPRHRSGRGARACCSSIRAVRPMISGSVGNRRSSSRASRIASSHSGARPRRAGRRGRIALVEQQIDHGRDGGRGARRAPPRPAPRRHLGLGDAALARVMRCSIAALARPGRRGRSASPSSPETMRSASAICCVAGRSGWQQMNSSRSTSSR